MVGNNYWMDAQIEQAFPSSYGTPAGYGSTLNAPMGQFYQPQQFINTGLTGAPGGQRMPFGTGSALQDGINTMGNFGTQVADAIRPGYNAASGFLGNIGTKVNNAVGGFVDDWNAAPNFDTIDTETGMKTQGKFLPTVQALGTAFGAFTGLQQMNMAREQMAFQKSAWQEQFDLQKGEFEYARKRRDERRANYENMKKRA